MKQTQKILAIVNLDPHDRECAQAAARASGRQYAIYDFDRSGNSVLPRRNRYAAVLVIGSSDWDFAHQSPILNHLCGLREANVPLLGIGAGHQLMACAFGGTVAPNRHGLQIGTKMSLMVRERAADALWSWTWDYLEVQVVNSMSVVGRPDDSRPLGCTHEDQYLILHYGQRAWSCQFHPEMRCQQVRRAISVRSETIRAQGQDPAALSSDCRETVEARRVLRRFAALVTDNND